MVIFHILCRTFCPLNLLPTLFFEYSSKENLLKKFPNRSYDAIKLRAGSFGLKKKINELLQEVEYDVIWHFLQHYFDTLSERQLLELIEFVEKTLSGAHSRKR